MEDINWIGNWKPIHDSDYQRRLALELRRELENNVGHILHGQDVVFVAELIGSCEKDFVVFALPKSEFSTVHLTYNVEHDPRWPWCTSIGDRSKLIEFIECEAKELG